MNKVVVYNESHDSKDMPGDLYVINEDTYIRASCDGCLRLVSLANGNRWADNSEIPSGAHKVPKGSTVTLAVV